MFQSHKSAIVLLVFCDPSTTSSSILFFRSLLERDELVNIRWELWEVTVLLVAFVVAQFAFYACLPYLLKLSSATALNLNLLATDYYNIVAGIIFFKYKVSLINSFSARWLILFEIISRNCPAFLNIERVS